MFADNRAVNTSLSQSTPLPRSSGIKIEVRPEILSDWQRATQEIESDFAPDYDRVEWEENSALNVMREEDEAFLLDSIKSVGRNLSSLKTLVAGTGTGRELTLLAQYGMCIDGVDLALPYLEITSQKLARLAMDDPSKIRLINSPIEGFLKDAPSNSYDCVSCLFSVINLLEDWRGALREFSRVLKPGGLLVLSAYGSASARVYQALDKGSLGYAPSILIRRTPEGLALGEGGQVLNAQFPEPRELSNELRSSGLSLVKRRGFLDLLSLLPKDPCDLPRFVEVLQDIDPDLARQVSGKTYASAMASILADDQTRAFTPETINNFAYVGYAAYKEII